MHVLFSFVILVTEKGEEFDSKENFKKRKKEITLRVDLQSEFFTWFPGR